MRRWGLVAALLLAAVPAPGSNMGVALRVDLSWTPQRFHVISLRIRAVEGDAPGSTARRCATAEVTASA